MLGYTVCRLVVEAVSRANGELPGVVGRKAPERRKAGASSPAVTTENSSFFSEQQGFLFYLFFYPIATHFGKGS